MSRYHLSAAVFNAPVSRIDHQAGIIFGVTVAKEGPARGHDGFIDQTFLLQVVELAAQRPQGIKARFGHPNMCATALGTYLGRFHNYAYQAGRVTADLHLDLSAKNTPHGDLFSYVLNMAASNPDMFGASLVFESGAFHQVETESSGKKSTARYFRLKELRATDIVDDPAATDGLFSAETLPAQATQWLDQNPELTELIFSKPQNLIEFLNNYLDHSPMNLSDSIRQNFRKIFNPNAFDQPDADPSAQSAPDPQPVPSPDVPPSAADAQPIPQPEPDELFNLFSAFVGIFPDSGFIPNDDGSFSLQTPEGLQPLSPSEISQTMLHAFSALKSSLDAAQQMISRLNTQLAAKPTIPTQVTDPQVSSALHSPAKDETGKHILASIPPEMRYRLRKNKPTPTT